MNEQNIYNEPATLTAELQDAAFEYLLLNPGSEFGDWSKGLIEEYPAEVVDALGNTPNEVNADLADLWETDYTDPKTGIEQKFSEWAMSFANLTMERSMSTSIKRARASDHFVEANKMVQGSHR